MDSKVSRSILGGVIGTVIMTMIMFVAPMMGMPKMSPPDMLAGMMGMPIMFGGNYAELTINNNMQKNTDIIIDLKGENTYAFGGMYKNYFGMVNRFVINNNGTTNDAEDIFQDTMLILVEKLRKDNFGLTAFLKTYIMAISQRWECQKCRHLICWLE